MATYILFWNPDISSYNMERFHDDFKYGDSVGNWSFNEYEKVKKGDRFYMIRCGQGKTGIVMHGVITSKCYESGDWSPKRRRHIYYADIVHWVMVNPETAPDMLTPDLLTRLMPDFNWYGGSSGRLLSPEYAKVLDELWAKYVNNNPRMFHHCHAHINEYWQVEYTQFFRKALRNTIPQKCEICGYAYKNYFDKEIIKKEKLFNYLYPFHRSDSRFLYSICRNCSEVPTDDLLDILNKCDD